MDRNGISTLWQAESIVDREGGVMISRTVPSCDCLCQPLICFMSLNVISREHRPLIFTKRIFLPTTRLQFFQAFCHFSPAMSSFRSGWGEIHLCLERASAGTKSCVSSFVVYVSRGGKTWSSPAHWSSHRTQRVKATFQGAAHKSI